MRINIDDVPTERRDDPRFHRLLTYYDTRFKNPNQWYGSDEFIRQIVFHESGHAVYARKFADVTFRGPHIIYDTANDKFDMCGGGIDWSNSRNSDIEVTGKMLIAGPTVSEFFTGKPDPGWKGDIDDLRIRLARGYNEEYLQIWIIKTKASIILDLQEDAFQEEIRQQADEFYRILKAN
jgi:hypothetical protein